MYLHEEMCCCSGHHNTNQILRDRIVQLVMCLATDASLTADPVVASSISARSHTFVEMYYEIILGSFSLPLNHLRRIVVSYKGKYVHGLVQACPEKCG